MSKYYTCRAIIEPQERTPGKRLCLVPTVDGLNCRVHIGAGHGLPLVNLNKTVTCAPDQGQTAAVGEQSAAVNPESQPAETPAARPFWPLNDDGSICSPPPHIMPGYVEPQEEEQCQKA